MLPLGDGFIPELPEPSPGTPGVLLVAGGSPPAVSLSPGRAPRERLLLCKSGRKEAAMERGTEGGEQRGCGRWAWAEL